MEKKNLPQKSIKIIIYNNFLEYTRKVATNYIKYNYMNYYNNITKKKIKKFSNFL